MIRFLSARLLLAVGVGCMVAAVVTLQVTGLQVLGVAALFAAFVLGSSES